ncbi:hypothetical protein L873DRAFT_376277 [Choiromyces venosus 120613-1]|uniref:F-box domain-containing protein n=1 Tax=Choiromyces venosus 120613-1 TaxID=1336337 RepID=A0A3N4J1G9_9PEZI|nr:hypothetical protein L873DRAFT_376277 [Choiromyces venosus 120613-1]
MSLLALPSEMVYQIVQGHDPPDLNSLIRVCRRLAILLTPALWDSVFYTSSEKYALKALFSAAGNDHHPRVSRLLDKGAIEKSGLKEAEVLKKVVKEQSPDVLNTLFGCGILPHSADKQNPPLLTTAIKARRIDMVKYLLSRCDTDVNELNSYGETPLGSAACVTDVDIISLLLVRTSTST